VEEKHSRRKNFNFSVLLFYMEGNQTRFVESSDSYNKKLVANAVLESTKMPTKYAIARLSCDMKINGRYKINKPFSGLLECRLIMTLA